MNKYIILSCFYLFSSLSGNAITKISISNKEAARKHQYIASSEPKDRLIIITCMDTRIKPYALFGIKPGQAHIMRNAGGIVTEDTIRSILLSIHALGTKKIMLVEHTDCGVMGLNNTSFRNTLINTFNTDTTVPQQFYGFEDLSNNIKRQIQKIKDHPWIPNDTIVRGFILNIQTGILDEVQT